MKIHPDWPEFIKQLERDVQELDAVKTIVIDKDGAREERSSRQISLYGPPPPTVEALEQIMALCKKYRLTLETKDSPFLDGVFKDGQTKYYIISLIPYSVIHP